MTAVRDLSEGITGYEVRCDKLYGRVSGLSEGSLYIDVDTDSHSVISLTGDEDASREYMLLPHRTLVKRPHHTRAEHVFS